MASPMTLPLLLNEQRKITVDEYHQMIEAGVFDERPNVELLEGVLVDVASQSTAHAETIVQLTRILVRAMPDGFTVRPGVPMTIGRYSEPEPDFSVVRDTPGGRPEGHPATAALVIEVAKSSLHKDREAKAAIYARAGVEEYWIVNLVARQVEIHKKPDVHRARFEERIVLEETQSVTPETVPIGPIPIASFLG